MCCNPGLIILITEYKAKTTRTKRKKSYFLGIKTDKKIVGTKKGYIAETKRLFK